MELVEHGHPLMQPRRPSGLLAVAPLAARRPLRVMHLLETLGRGGAERNLVNVLRFLPKGEHAVCYLRSPDDYARDLRDAGIPVRCLGLHRRRDLGHVLGELRAELVRGDYQLLFTQVWLADIVGRLGSLLARVPVISAVQTSAYEPETLATYSRGGRWKARLFNRPLDAMTARLCHQRLVAVSKFVGDQTVQRLGVPAEQVVVIPNSVDTARFVPTSQAMRQSARAELGLTREDRVLVTVGKLNKGKGNDLLLGALPAVLRAVPRAKLLILGHGTDGPRLMQQVQRMNLHQSVRFLGQRSDVERHLAAADIFVFASRYEGLPLSVLEAMATGLPCVLSNIPPHREISNEGQVAVLVPPTPAAWAQGILRLLQDPAESSRLAQAGLLRVHEHYNARVVAAALEEVFQTEARPERWERSGTPTWLWAVDHLVRLPLRPL